MTDTQCPYCEAEQEICHDDGYGYDEDVVYEQECRQCGKTFQYTTRIMFRYTAYCQPEDHVMESWGPKHPTMQGCTRCDYCDRLGGV